MLIILTHAGHLFRYGFATDSHIFLLFDAIVVLSSEFVAFLLFLLQEWLAPVIRHIRARIGPPKRVPRSAAIVVYGIYVFVDAVPGALSRW